MTCTTCGALVEERLGACASCGAPSPGPRPSGPSTSLSQRSLNSAPDCEAVAVGAVGVSDVLMGRYVLEEKIGEGGMGSVYIAADRELHRRVAVKLLASAWVADREVVERFEREGRLTAQFDHPHIAPVYDVGRHAGRPFIVMKLLVGDTLTGHLRTRGTLSAQETLALMRQLAKGLDYIHSRGFIHRDIKTGNIFIGPDGHATILDFGILRSKSVPAGFTRAGTVMGTPQYMAPEQALGQHEVDHRVDLYALGVVLFECLTGSLPFDSDSELELIQLQAHAAAPDAAERAPSVSHAVSDVVARALAKRPSDRFASGAELVAALERALEPSPRPSPWPRRAAALLALAAAGIALLTVASSTWKATQVKAPQAKAQMPEISVDAGSVLPVVGTGRSAADVGEGSRVETGETMVTPEGSSPRAAEPSLGQLKVITTHQGEPFWAQVSIDGVARGTTPIRLELTKGRHTVQVERAGFRAESREIRVASGKSVVVRIELVQ